MVFHALVCFPNIQITKINEFRKKYDPHYDLVKPHITLIFPLEQSKISQNSLSEHIKSITTTWKPFTMELRGLHKSFDHWLFLLVGKGKQKLIQLHDELYTGILAPFLKKDLEYIPHITIGRFIKKSDELNQEGTNNNEFDEARYKVGLRKAENLQFNFLTEVNSFHLIQVNDAFTQSKILKEFPLNPR